MLNKPIRLAVLGTGLMGQPIARRLVDAGFDVTVWNRSPEKILPLLAAGAKAAENPAGAARGADAVITMLTDGSVVKHVLFAQGVADVLVAGAMVIDMSSIKPAEAVNHVKRLALSGIAHLDAPVSGGTRGAEEGNLAIMVGGLPEEFERAQKIFAALGRATLVGPSGAGQLAKLANQAIVATNIGGVAEALLLVSGGGADPAAVRTALRGGFADSRILQEHGQRMLDRNFLPGGPLEIHIKDLNNILEAAHEFGVAMPIAEKMLSLFETVRDELGGGGYDHSALLLALELMSKPNRVGTGEDKVP